MCHKYIALHWFLQITIIYSESKVWISEVFVESVFGTDGK